MSIKKLITPVKEDKENKFSLFYDAATCLNATYFEAAQPYINGNYYALNGVGSRIGYVYNVTSNCQIGSLSSFYTILNSSNRNKFLKWVYESTVSMGIMKPQLIIDVNAQYSNTVDKMFEGYIVFKNDYISTNESRMTMYLVKSEALKNLK